MSTITKYIKYFLRVNWFRTLIFNVHYFGIHGLKFPVLIAFGCRFGKLGGSVCIEKYSFGTVCLGLVNGSFDLGHSKSSYWNNEGSVFLGNNVHIAKGFHINIKNGGQLEIGEDFVANSNLLINCEKSIRFGKHNLIGWDVSFVDSDGHSICTDGKVDNNPKNIEIDNHVWICAKTSVLKGSRIGKDSVIGFGSIVSGEKEMNSIIAGIPAKEIRKKIDWIR